MPIHVKLGLMHRPAPVPRGRVHRSATVKGRVALAPPPASDDDDDGPVSACAPDALRSPPKVSAKRRRNAWRVHRAFGMDAKYREARASEP